MKNLVLISLLFTGLFYACKTSKDATAGGNNTDIISITHGTSFGMCRGYCIHEEEYTMNEAIVSHKSWDSIRNKPKVKKMSFTQDEFNKLTSLLNKKEWEKLEERIGCPDCTDRGSEYVIIKTASGTKKVTFDAYADVPAIAELLAQLRQHKKLFEYDPNLEDK
jgi:hypothetical protein